MKILSVVGARPQFVKLAPIAHAFASDPAVRHVIVHTGQHYDADLSDVFFDRARHPRPRRAPRRRLRAHGVQTGAMLAALETDPGARAARLDAGLRRHQLDGRRRTGRGQAAPAGRPPGGRTAVSFNRRMPEEHNRVLTDHAADLLLAPTQVAMRHLADERACADRAVLVGDVMIDVCLRMRDSVAGREHAAAILPDGLDPDDPYLIATFHRADNTDDPTAPGRTHRRIGRRCPCRWRCWPIHGWSPGPSPSGSRSPRARSTSAARSSYPDMVAAVLGSVGVVTDSGGLQKEAYLLGAPCTTLRTETEWVETLGDGWNVLDPGPGPAGRARRSPPPGDATRPPLRHAGTPRSGARGTERVGRPADRRARRLGCPADRRARGWAARRTSEYCTQIALPP